MNRLKKIFPDPEHSLQPRQSGERLIPGAQPGSETIEDVDDELLVVPADDGHLSGRKSVVEVFTIYGQMLRIILPMVLMSFAIFGGWSYVAPKILCLESIKNLAGSPTKYKRCMYVTDGNYRQDTILKIPLLMFTCAKAAYLAGGVLLLTASAMFGWENIRLHEKCFLAGSVSCAFLVPMIGALVNDWPLDRPRTTRAITISTYYINLAILGLVCARYTNNRVNKYRWFILFFTISLAVIFYDIILPWLVTSRSTSEQKLLVRLVIHPIIWTAMAASMRHVGRHIGTVPNMLQTVLLLYPYIYNAVYGRFLLLQLSKSTSVMALNYLIVLLNVIGHLASRNADTMLLRLMYGKRTAQVTLAQKEVTEWRMAEILARSTAVYISIVGAAAVLSFGSITPSAGTLVNVRGVWVLAAVQAVTYFASDVVAISIEMKYHGMKFSPIMGAPNITKPLIKYLGILIFFGMWMFAHGLITLYCPRYYDDERGVLLELCNQENLFEHLRPWKLAGTGV